MSLLTPQCDPAFHTLSSKPISTRKETGYSIFGIGADRRKEAEWLFHQEKATLQSSQKVHMYSENALEFGYD
jgi:hypothetical protein